MAQPPNSAPPTKLARLDYATVMERAAPPPEAAETLAGGTEAADAIDRLEAGGFLIEAVRVMAHALPKREAVWWACMCAASTAPASLPEEDRLARETAELWVRQQKDEPRRAAYAHAEKVNFQTAEAWTAAAAYFSGDNLSLPNLPVVPPPAHLTGVAVTGSVTLSSVREDVSRQKARLKRFLESGRNIAAGGQGRIPPEEA